MVGTLMKQPNGRYCVVDYAGEIRHYNLTEQDIINLYISDAKAYIGTAKHYGEIIASTSKSGGVSDETLQEMGFDKPYNELVKFIPRKPLDQYYSGPSFTTYGKCPSCGDTVENCMGYFEEKCRNCGQMLKW